MTPHDDLTFNVPTGSEDWIYLLIPEACSGKVAQVRVSEDNIPQADGSILHRRFTTGYQLQLSVSLWQDRETPACSDVVAAMAQRLSGCLRSILNSQEGRVTFQEGETGEVRLVDQVRLRDYSLAIDGPLTAITFILDSPFPYSLTFTQDIIDISDGMETIFNEGNVDFWPVVKVFGPETAFVIGNDTLGELITFDAGLPGGQVIPSGHFAEFDFFRNTCYMDGDQADLLACLDPTQTDFFPLISGANDISTTAASIEVLKNDAWD